MEFSLTVNGKEWPLELIQWGWRRIADNMHVAWPMRGGKFLGEDEIYYPKDGEKKTYTLPINVQRMFPFQEASMWCESRFPDHETRYIQRTVDMYAQPRVIVCRYRWTGHDRIKPRVLWVEDTTVKRWDDITGGRGFEV